MKKTLLWILIAVAVAALTGCGYILYRTSRTQPDLHFDNPTIPRAFFPHHNGTIELFEGSNFVVNTGVSYSSINRTTLEKLRGMGMDIEECSAPIFGRGDDGKLRTFTDYVKVTLPIGGYQLDVDSVYHTIYWRPTGEIINTVSDVNMIVTENNQVNQLGMDFLENFILEFQYYRKCIALRSRVEEDYQELGTMYSPRTFENFLGFGHRYYIDARVDNHEQHPFYLQSGMDYVSMKLPIGDTVIAKGNLNPDMFRSVEGPADIRLVKNAFVELGTRSGTHEVFYTPHFTAKYCINPLRYFTQDVAMDFSGGKIYLRPFAVLRYSHLQEDTEL